jgi:hypothetical protein
MEQNKNIGIRPFPNLRIRDLVRPAFRLRVACRCGHTADLDPVDLLSTKGPNERVSRLNGKMRCRQCGQAAWSSISLEPFDG